MHVPSPPFKLSCGAEKKISYEKKTELNMSLPCTVEQACSSSPEFLLHSTIYV